MPELIIAVPSQTALSTLGSSKSYCWRYEVTWERGAWERRGSEETAISKGLENTGSMVFGKEEKCKEEQKVFKKKEISQNRYLKDAFA